MALLMTQTDLKTIIHEEADTIIVAQAIYAAKIEGKHVVVVADDTDVYILLLYHYHAESLKIPMKLQSTQTGRAFIDVTATVLKLSDIIPQLLPAHALSGCDNVSWYWERQDAESCQDQKV
jgi:5'-3' exonuclease